MPFRSPKMYSFIFGFHRFVWWPKCTPASSRSFIAIPDNRSSLPLNRLLNWNRLRAPARPYFLRSLTRESDVSSPSFFNCLRSSALNSTSAREMPRRTAPAWPFTPPPATVARMSNLLAGLGQQQRPPHLRAQRIGREVVVELAVVDGDGAGAGTEEHAGGGCLAAAGCVVFDAGQVTRPRFSVVAGRRADAPRPRRPSACGTSRRPSSSSGSMPRTASSIRRIGWRFRTSTARSSRRPPS